MVNEVLEIVEWVRTVHNLLSLFSHTLTLPGLLAQIENDRLDGSCIFSPQIRLALQNKRNKAQSDHETLRQLQRHLVKPALAVHTSYPQESDAAKSRIFDAALKCLGLIAVADEVRYVSTVLLFT